MSEYLLLGFSSIIILGISAQWLAWKLHMPSIVLLLAVGFVAGPVTGFIVPDEIMGPFLLPFVSISVAIILFEGGLSLRLSEIEGVGSVVRNLVTGGVLITWAMATAASYYLFDLEMSIAILLGAVLVVTGPTVVIPLLRQIRPVGRLGSILKWEGIVVDPIGAMLAVLVYETIVVGLGEDTMTHALTGIMMTVIAGVFVGLLGGILLVVLLKRYLVPDFLQNSVTLMTVVLAFTVSNLLQGESGLLAVTVMGIFLANQTTVTVKHIIEFKENLRVLLISVLFIILSARLKLSDFEEISILSAVLFILFLILVVRPLSVYFSTIGSGLSAKERLYIMCLAPRGIVAAAISSVFMLSLIEKGFNAESLVPLTFIVIVGTVIVYGLLAEPIAKALDIARPNPQGVMIVGAHPWAISLGKVLKEEGIDVIITDTNWANVSNARMAGLQTYYGSVISEYALRELDLSAIGRLIAMTANDNINSLSALHFSEIFSRTDVFQLIPEDEKSKKEALSQNLRGRLLFNEGATYSVISKMIEKGCVVKKSTLTKEFDYDNYKKLYGEELIPMFLIQEKGVLSVFSSDSEITPKIGQTIISVVKPVDEKEIKERLEEDKEEDKEKAEDEQGNEKKNEEEAAKPA